MLSTSTAKWWMQGPPPAAFDSADWVPASYLMSATSSTPSLRWREVWSRTFSVFISTKPKTLDRKSTRLNSSHQIISYAVFCLKKKKYAPQMHGTEHSGSGRLDHHVAPPRVCRSSTC